MPVSLPMFLLFRIHPSPCLYRNSCFHIPAECISLRPVVLLWWKPFMQVCSSFFDNILSRHLLSHLASRSLCAHTFVINLIYASQIPISVLPTLLLLPLHFLATTSTSTRISICQNLGDGSGLRGLGL